MHDPLPKTQVEAKPAAVAAPAAPLVGEPPSKWDGMLERARATPEYKAARAELEHEMASTEHSRLYRLAQAVIDASTNDYKECGDYYRVPPKAWLALHEEVLHLQRCAASPAASAGVPTINGLLEMVADFGDWRFHTGLQPNKAPAPCDLFARIRTYAERLASADSFYRSAADASEASGSAIPARPTLTGELRAISENLRTQDNRATSHPLFAVQQKRVIGGLDPEYATNTCWVDYDGEVPADEVARLDELDRAGEPLPNGARKLGYIEIWDFVTGCFTEQGCKDFLAINGHNLKEPRIYAYSAYRNREFINVRDWLLAGGDQKAAPLHPSSVQAVDGDEPVKWQKLGELHIDAWGRGQARVHACEVGGSITIEATNGDEAWRATFPAPWSKGVK